MKQQFQRFQKEGDNFEIANISFAYMNADVIKALEKRGDVLMGSQSNEALGKIDKIIDFIKEIPKKSKPTSAFVTFESNKAKEKVLNKMKSKKSWVTGSRSPNE